MNQICKEILSKTKSVSLIVLCQKNSIEHFSNIVFFPENAMWISAITKLFLLVYRMKDGQNIRCYQNVLYFLPTACIKMKQFLFIFPISYVIDTSVSHVDIAKDFRNIPKRNDSAIWDIIWNRSTLSHKWMKQNNENLLFSCIQLKKREIQSSAQKSIKRRLFEESNWKYEFQ